MNLMGCRLIHLKQTLGGLLKTGIPLIEHDGTKILPSFTADDIGIYVIIPKLAYFFGIALEQAIHVFFLGILLLPALIGIIGFFYYYNSWLQKLIATLGILLLTRQAYGLGDVYLAYFSCVVSLVPWALYFSKENRYTNAHLVFMIFSGFTIGFFHYVRSYAGLGVLLFIVSIFIMHSRFTHKEILKLSMAFMFGLTMPITYFNYSYTTSVNYAKQHLSEVSVGQKAHVFWHNIYIGFGLLKQGNPDDIAYDDSFGFNKALEKKPGLTIEQTEKYETIIKNEVINLVKNHWQFVIFTLFAKIGILLFYFFKYANIGLIAAFFYRKPWWLEIPFFIGGSFYALFPLLTMPTILEYALGFISFATLYGVVSLNFALSKRWQKS